VALLAALDLELAENSAEQGRLEPLVWSAAEQALRELLAGSVDRRVDLWRDYEASEDHKARLKMSAEIRLTDQNIARLLGQIKTDLPPAPSLRSQKAARAANARWSRAAP
jgi:hypothetical protein